ncbi:hypothetical protein Adt_18511 [Abeliophyllum distichum]|uniref:Uncharacterized protein n=1 Tax=Abeliophyllum distichum TaxID=126358 RepID=A0ABD1TJK4_9LAMI
MSFQKDFQNPSVEVEVEVDIQEPDCPFQTSSTFTEVIVLNILPTLGVGPSDKDRGHRFTENQIASLFRQIQGPIFYNRASGERKRINFSQPKKNLASRSSPKVVQMKLPIKAKSPPLAKGVVIGEPSPNATKSITEAVKEKGKEKLCNPILREERYAVEVKEYKKKINDMTSLVEHLEVEIQRRSMEVEEYKKNLEAKRLRADVHHLASNLLTS